MKIAWLSPLSASSAIGRATVQVAECIQASTEIHLWCADSGDLHKTTVPVFPFVVSDAFEQVLRTYDTVLYSLGDQYAFHREVFLMSRRVRGIAILHDYVMHHFFMGYFLEQPGGIDDYLETMARLYGAGARAAAEASFVREDDEWRIRETPPPLWVTDRVVDYPLFEETLHMATAVVGHSTFICERLRRATDVPVRRIDLPAILRPVDDLLSRSALGVPNGRALVVTTGHVNPNKLVHEMIDALGRHPELAAKVFYAVVGLLPSGAYSDELRAAIARGGLESVVRLVGRCSDEELRAWLQHADICLNFRRPVMDGGSASLVEQMMAGKAVVVSDAGVYAEMPSDCVIKIEAGREAERVAGVVGELVDNSALREQTGNRARAYAEEHFQPARYAAELLDFIDASSGFAAMVSYADRIGSVLRQMGIRPGRPVVETVARESGNLFGEPVSSPWRPGRDPV